REAKKPKEGQRSCLLLFLARASKGEVIAFDREHVLCRGGATGLGFGNQYSNFLGGLEGFCRFLSTGFESWNREILDSLKDIFPGWLFEKMLKGERYKKSPELVRKFVEILPTIEVPTRYVIFKPLSKVEMKSRK
ncbi:MAG: DUF169 domain-containing protein, partial [Archaeoglobaceae archaeon]|nr:DUF169 domain-containing protein [Archaeoglobaceae archaeon]